jgi:hypothetical protein
LSNRSRAVTIGLVCQEQQIPASSFALPSQLNFAIELRRANAEQRLQRRAASNQAELGAILGATLEIVARARRRAWHILDDNLGRAGKMLRQVPPTSARTDRRRHPD